MYNDPNALVQPFLHKPIADCTIREIKTIAQQYPYFAPAQLALLKKLKEEGSPEYELQLQKAVLYYYDPVQFEAFVHSEKFTTRFDIDLQETEKEAESIHEPGIGIQPEESIAPAITEGKTPPLPALSSPVEEATAPAFEPYHTVDYFASQGIKLSGEEVAKDKIGQQLKSFTEWLKTMKRLPAAEITKNLDAGSENKVERLAQHSVEQSDVVTEAMAEVWIKQGNGEKAVEVYRKLSLLNPSKNAYFAAKIDHLKASGI